MAAAVERVDRVCVCFWLGSTVVRLLLWLPRAIDIVFAHYHMDGLTGAVGWRLRAPRFFCVVAFFVCSVCQACCVLVNRAGSGHGKRTAYCCTGVWCLQGGTVSFFVAFCALVSFSSCRCRCFLLDLL